jgi:ATP-dependent Zn protease
MKKAAFFAVLLVVAVMIGWIVMASRPNQHVISYTQFLQQVEAGQIADVRIASGNSRPSRATIRLKDGETGRTVLPPDYSASLALLESHLVNVEIQDASTDPVRFLVNATPFLLLLGVWVYFMTTGRRFLRGRN